MAGFLRRRSKHERSAFQLYGSAVAAARDPYLYATLGVPDTLDGRFDAIVLYVYLIVRRLDADSGPALAQAVFDAMFMDMDINLREMGVGDLSVGKKMRKLGEAFYGRARAYEVALAAPEMEGLDALIERTIYDGVDASETASLVSYVRRSVAALEAIPLNDVMAAKLNWAPIFR